MFTLILAQRPKNKTFFAQYNFPRTLKSQLKLSTKSDICTTLLLVDSFRIMAVSKMQMTRGGWRRPLALWIFGEILHAISCLTALICLALFWVMFRIKVWARKWALKRDKIYTKKYSRTAQRGSKRGSQAEISSWQSNKSVKITHLLSWQTKEGISFSFISWLFYDYHMWSIKTSSLIFQVMERTLKTMGLHPTYLEAFKATHDKILSEEVPISALDRHHIALMVSQKLLCMHPWLL